MKIFKAFNDRSSGFTFTFAVFVKFVADFALDLLTVALIVVKNKTELTLFLFAS